MYYSEEIGLEGTDPRRWRLFTDEFGRETWEYLLEEESKVIPQSTYVQHLLKLEEFPEPIGTNITTPLQSAIKGGEFFKLLQDSSGIFPCPYRGPMFMNIGYVAAHYFCKLEIPMPKRLEMIRYIVNTAHPVDGGWGLHSEDKSTCFGTTMNYVALRLLGLPADNVACVRARQTLHRLGGALGNAHWGKAWLAILNLYEWEGVNPAPPEIWLLPYSTFLHPGKWWVHTRAIYLPLAYLSANQTKCSLDPLLVEIRNEIYTPKQLPYESINFSANRDNVCGVDLYFPHTKILNFLNWCVVQYERYVRPRWLLKLANKKLYELIKKEYLNTDYLCIAPVSFAFNMIVTYLEEGSDSTSFERLVDRSKDVVFHSAQGMTVMGTNGSQVWEAAFMVQYFIMAGLADRPEFHKMIKKTCRFLIRSQFTEECITGSFRDKRRGGWPFSTKPQGYTVSDCTAEALKAIIMVENHPAFSDMKREIEKVDYHAAVDVLLSLQNTEKFEFGSFSTYEVIRSTPLLELINPAEVFNNIMVEYPYVECTDSSVLGLTYFLKYFQNYKRDQILMAIKNATNYIITSQADDGSWYGSWGICFTYASMFAHEALYSAGYSYINSECVRRGCDFLVSKQREDGGWSECIKSCETGTYVNSNQSLTVQTSWSVIGLILADYPHIVPIAKGIKFIMDKQLPTGEWEFEQAEGVFNHSCAIEYPSYRFVFPIKALGLYQKKYGDKVLSL